MADNIDVLSYHCSLPPQPESGYSSKSTASLTPSRQRLIDSVFRQKHHIGDIIEKQSWYPTKRVDNRFIVPSLYANQRVLQRSSSRDAPLRLQRDLKKTVAFGRTTTIGQHSSMRPCTSTGNLYFAPKIQSQPEITDKLEKDVDQLQQIVKTLIEENIHLQACLNENRTLQADVKHLTKTVQELSDSNSTLKTRVNLLEVWYARIMSAEGKSQQFAPNYFKENERVREKVARNDRFDWRTRRRIAQIYIGDRNCFDEEESSRTDKGK